MTTQDTNTGESAEELAEEQPEKENPLFLISIDRLKKLERSPVHLVAGRLASTRPSKSKPVNERGEVKGLIR